jgi:hypothetical protein
MAKPFRTFVPCLVSVLVRFVLDAPAVTVASESLGEMICSSLVAEDGVDVFPVLSAADSAGVRLRTLRIDGRPIRYIWDLNRGIETFWAGGQSRRLGGSSPNNRSGSDTDP